MKSMSRGCADPAAVTSTMLSPQRTTTEPPACLAHFPVSMMISLPPTMAVSRTNGIRVLPPWSALAVLEVAQAAVDELARLRRRARGVVALLEQRDLEAAQRSVARDARAGDAAADHDDVVGRGAAHYGNDTFAPLCVKASPV